MFLRTNQFQFDSHLMLTVTVLLMASPSSLAAAHWYRPLRSLVTLANVNLVSESISPALSLLLSSSP